MKIKAIKIIVQNESNERVEYSLDLTGERDEFNRSDVTFEEWVSPKSIKASELKKDNHFLYSFFDNLKQFEGTPEWIKKGDPLLEVKWG